MHNGPDMMPAVGMEAVRNVVAHAAAAPTAVALLAADRPGAPGATPAAARAHELFPVQDFAVARPRVFRVGGSHVPGPAAVMKLRAPPNRIVAVPVPASGAVRVVVVAGAEPSVAMGGGGQAGQQGAR